RDWKEACHRCSLFSDGFSVVEVGAGDMIHEQITCLHVGNLRKSGGFMQLSQSVSMRMDQRQLLTPRMIQSMEILQLPLMALEERIEQELQANPVLELREPDGTNPDGEQAPQPASEAHEEFSEGEQTLVEKEKNDADD